jgi:hypothetical protein
MTDASILKTMVGEAVGELEHEVMLVESIEDLKDVVKMIAKAVDDGRFDAEPDDELTGMLDQMDLRISAIEKRLDSINALAILGKHLIEEHGKYMCHFCTEVLPNKWIRAQHEKYEHYDLWRVHLPSRKHLS